MPPILIGALVGAVATFAVSATALYVKHEPKPYAYTPPKVVEIVPALGVRTTVLEFGMDGWKDPKEGGYSPNAHPTYPRGYPGGFLPWAVPQGGTFSTLEVPHEEEETNQVPEPGVLALLLLPLGYLIWRTK